MKRYIKSTKFYAYNLPEEEWEDRLSISAKEVEPHIYDDIDEKDQEVFKYLIDNKIIPSIHTSPDIRNNPYYDMEDKFIVPKYTEIDRRTYTVPYAGSGRFETGSLFEKLITVYDDRSVSFGDSKPIPEKMWRKLSPITLKNYFWRS